MDKELIKKFIDFNFGGVKAKFAVNQALFSSFKVDEGTKILLNSLRKNSEIKYGSVLDLGCGYGVMGVFLKNKYPESKVFGVDRDILSVEFAKYNAGLNDLDIDFKPSLDYSSVKGKFDLIVCNYPAKGGVNLMKKFFYGASRYLNKGGVFACVIVKELKEEFEAVLHDDMEIIFEEKKAGYFVYHIRFKKKILFDEDVYGDDLFLSGDYSSEIELNDVLFVEPNDLAMVKKVSSGSNSLLIKSRDLLVLEILKDYKTSQKILDFDEKIDTTFWAIDSNYDNNTIQYFFEKYYSQSRQTMAVLGNKKTILFLMKKNKSVNVLKHDVQGKWAMLVVGK